MNNVLEWFEADEDGELDQPMCTDCPTRIADDEESVIPATA